jgi:beta-lactam-binding protein with PASTA domain
MSLANMRRPPAPVTTPRAVPDVHGLSARAAALTLHRAGFRVQLDGLGTAKSTAPAAGDVWAAGTLVHVSTTP